MKKTKLLYVILLSVMVFCFTGCGNQQSSNKDGNTDFASGTVYNADESRPDNNIMNDVASAVDKAGNTAGDVIKDTGDAIKDATDDVTGSSNNKKRTNR